MGGQMNDGGTIKKARQSASFLRIQQGKIPQKIPCLSRGPGQGTKGGVFTILHSENGLPDCVQVNILSSDFFTVRYSFFNGDYSFFNRG